MSIQFHFFHAGVSNVATLMLFWTSMAAYFQRKLKKYHYLKHKNGLCKFLKMELWSLQWKGFTFGVPHIHINGLSQGKFHVNSIFLLPHWYTQCHHIDVFLFNFFAVSFQRYWQRDVSMAVKFLMSRGYFWCHTYTFEQPLNLKFAYQPNFDSSTSVYEICCIDTILDFQWPLVSNKINKLWLLNMSMEFAFFDSMTAKLLTNSGYFGCQICTFQGLRHSKLHVYLILLLPHCLVHTLHSAWAYTTEIKVYWLSCC